MERLTEYINKVPAIDTTKVRFHFEVNGMIGGDVAKRLAAYEDTGLTPEDFALGLNAAARKKLGSEYYGLTPEQLDKAVDLFNADREGRVVLLSCKVGDTVWTNISVKGDRYRLADRPYSVKVVFLGMGEKSAYFHVEYDNGRVFPFDFDKFGKTVFLTREEAEAALKGESDG